MTGFAIIALLYLGWARVSAGLYATSGADVGSGVQPRRPSFLSIEEVLLYHRGSPPPLAANSSARANSSIADALQALKFQVRYELELGRIGNKPKPKDKRALAAIVMLGFGFFGCDRCFLGQITLGVLKGVTCGGFFCWWIIDSLIIIMNILLFQDSIDTFYMTAAFKKETVDAAFWIWLVLFAVNIYVGYLRARLAEHAFKQALKQPPGLPPRSSAARPTPAPFFSAVVP